MTDRCRADARYPDDTVRIEVETAMNVRSRNSLAVLAFATILALSPGALAAQEAEPPEPSADVELPEGVTAEMVAAGRMLFGGKGSCFACHGRNAAGTPLAPDLTDAEWLHAADGSFDAIVELINAGVPSPTQHPAPMPPKGGAQLSDEEVRALAAYIYALGHGSPGG